MPTPRKPTVMLQLAGALDAKRARERAAEPKPKAGIGDAPKWLDRYSKAVWQELQEEIAAGVLTRQDRQIFAVLCCLLAQFRDAPFGMPTSRIAQMNSLLGQFGMSPSTRSKVTAAPAVNPENRFAIHRVGHPEAVNPFAQFAKWPKG